MRFVQHQLAIAAMLAAASAASAAPQPVGDTRLFVPPVSEDPSDLVAHGTNCIALHRVRSTRIIAGEGIVYQMAGQKAVINRPRHGGANLQNNQILIFRTRGSLLCVGDVVHLASGSPGMTTGFVALGRFVPYRSRTRD